MLTIRAISSIDEVALLLIEDGSVVASSPDRTDVFIVRDATTGERVELAASAEEADRRVRAFYAPP